MRIKKVLILLLMTHQLFSQGFECDGSMYLVLYVQSIGESILYQVQEDDYKFTFEEIKLSEKRRLTALSYHVRDKHLYALDVDTYEMVRIDKNGTVVAIGIPNNLDQSFSYFAGHISPDGLGYSLVAYNEEMGFDQRYYNINMVRGNLNAGYFGITSEQLVNIHAIATDPTTGTTYGYDNRIGKLVQISIGGNVATYAYPDGHEGTIDALFFNREGELFGYSGRKGMFYINKLTGEVVYITKGPEGTHGDGCSCPYTNKWEKTVVPHKIIPCEPFEVRYRFLNHMGIGQTWLDLRDTFPEGFEVLNLKSTLISDANVLVGIPENVVALKNLIFLMGENNITATILPPPGYFSEFKSQAVVWDFPEAFGHIALTDDPMTEEKPDPTVARVISEEEIDFTGAMQYSCDGESVSITAPFQANTYEWSNGSTTESIEVSDVGWYSLRAENDCIVFYDSVLIESFPGPDILRINGRDQIILGDSVHLTASLDRGNIKEYIWESDTELLPCSDCPYLSLAPLSNTRFTLQVMDQNGCLYSNELMVSVEELRHFYGPNAFSPNGDGMNDYFFFQSSSPGVIRHLSIFNRWGNEVYDARNIPLNDQAFGWDGRRQGNILPTGVYIWIVDIEYFDGHREKETGEIILFSPNN